MLQKSDDEALNGKLWYFDDTISGYEKRLKQYPPNAFMAN
jgi:hypothetical protein